LFWKLVDDLRTCRSCEGRVHPWDNVCRHCGAGCPVFIGCSPAVIVTAMLSEAVLVWLCFV
jgi:hypothetical protein